MAGPAIHGTLFRRNPKLLVGGRLLRQPGRSPLVQLLDRRGRVLHQLELASEAQGRALLEQARLGAAQTVSCYTLPPRWLNSPLLIIPLVLGPLLIFGPLSFALNPLLGWLGSGPGSLAHSLLLGGTLFAAALGGLLLLLRTNLRLSVGADGLHLRQRGRGRFIPHGQIRAVDRWPERERLRGGGASEGFDVVLRQGPPLRLRTLSERALLGDTAGDYIWETVVSSWQAAAPPPAPAPPLLLLLRGQRSASAWLQELEALTRGEGAAYRSALPSREMLWEVLENSGADPEQRAASAVVLCSTGGEVTRQRVEQIARAVAHPELQALLQAALRGGREGLRRALRRFVSGPSARA